MNGWKKIGVYGVILPEHLAKNSSTGIEVSVTATPWDYDAEASPPAARNFSGSIDPHLNQGIMKDVLKTYFIADPHI